MHPHELIPKQAEAAESPEALADLADAEFTTHGRRSTKTQRTRGSGGLFYVCRMRMIALACLTPLALACGTATGTGPDAAALQPRPIVFASDRDGNFDIYVMREDGTDVEQLTDTPDDALRPSWLPSGLEIAFERGEPAAKSIYVMRADGSEMRRLFDGRSPRWSPDGTRLVYVRDPPTSGLYVGDRHTGVTTLIFPTEQTPLDRRGQAGNPDWNRDSDRIAFRNLFPNFSHFRSDIDVIDPDGAARELLWPFADFPQWSPKGDRLAYISENQLVVQTFDPPGRAVVQ